MKFLLSSLILLISFIFWVSIVRAASQSIDATVKSSICGNGIKESGEECDNSDLGGLSCKNLGFSGGNLSCDDSCSFETDSCSKPSLNPKDVSSDDVDSLLAAGYLTVPSSQMITRTNSAKTTSEVSIKVPVSDGNNTITMPQNLTITREDGSEFDPTSDLSAGLVSTSSVLGLANGSSVGALQWGITGKALRFDSPITIRLYVGTEYVNDTLNIYRSESLSGGWTTDGLLSTTCLVDNVGICEFKATKASYYTAVLPPSSASSSSGTSPSSSSSSTSTSQSFQTSLPTIASTHLLPLALKVFDVNNEGRLDIQNIYTIAKIWFDGWESAINNSGHNPERSNSGSLVCDLNNDKFCNVQDFSVLMYWIER